MPNRGADPRARWMGAGLPADIRRAQSGQVPCSDALARQRMALVFGIGWYWGRAKPTY